MDVEGTKTLELFTSLSSSSESLMRILFAAFLARRGFRVGGTFSSCSSVSSPDSTVFSRSGMNGGGGLFSASSLEGDAERDC